MKYLHIDIICVVMNYTSKSKFYQKTQLVHLEFVHETGVL